MLTRKPNRSRSPFVLAVLAAALVTASCCPPPEGTPKSIIFLIGDGLGFDQITFARHLEEPEGGRFAFESMPSVGLVSVHAADNKVTDSAAAATAFATGVKTNNAMIGMNPAEEELESIADRAKEAGWKVGYVTSTSITHATPAGFYASAKHRYFNADDVGPDLLEQEPDLVFGGGLDDLLPLPYGKRQDGRNLVEEAEAQGYTIWRYGADLDAEVPEKVIGVFAGNHMPYRIDNARLPEPQRYPSLADLTTTALRALSRNDGRFFLMVEGGRIDHAGHSFDARTLASEVADFDEAVKVVLGYQKENPDTLVVLTADHATGGLAINDYVKWDEIKKQQVSLDWIKDGVRDVEEPATVEEVRELTGQPAISAEDVDPMRTVGDSYEASRMLGHRLGEIHGVTWIPEVDPWNTKGHTGEDVPIYATGPGASRFAGSLDNTDIPKRMCEIMGWPELNPGA